MSRGPYYKADELTKILDMRMNQKMTYKDIAAATGRTEAAIWNLIYHRKKYKEQMEKLTQPKQEVLDIFTPEVEVEAPVVTKELSPREMIKKLYNMGYRIENNEVVCYVRTRVNIKDIING